MALDIFLLNRKGIETGSYYIDGWPRLLSVDKASFKPRESYLPLSPEC